MIAVFWDDLYNSELEEGEILYFNDEANHRFIVEWDSIAHNDISSEPELETFQVILLDPQHYPTASGDGEIIFQYKKLTNKTSSTVGIENHTQDVGLQYLFDNSYDLTASVLSNEFAIKITTEHHILLLELMRMRIWDLISLQQDIN